MMTTQNPPPFTRPFICLYGASLAGIFWVLLVLWRRTITIRITGNLDRHIDALWHHNLILYFLCFPKVKENSCWLQHPALYMKPSHLLLKWNGVKKIAFGSSGTQGHAALGEVIAHVKNGGHTVMAPDGPAGPPMTLKKGIFILANHSNMAVSPIAYQCSKAIRLPSWDKKYLALPFSTVHVHFHDPMQLKTNVDGLLEKRLTFIQA